MKPTSSEPVTFGAPVFVGVAGMWRSGVSHDGERNEPNAYRPAPLIAEFGTSDSFSSPGPASS